MPTKIVIHCNEKELGMLKNHLWDRMVISPLDDIYLFETYLNKKDIPFISSLLSKMGGNIKVISPSFLIQEITNKLEEILAMYREAGHIK